MFCLAASLQLTRTGKLHALAKTPREDTIPVKFVSGFLAATYSHASDYKQNYLHVLSSRSAIFANVGVRGCDAKERKHDGNGVGGGQGGKSLRITQSIYTRRRK